MFLRHQDKQGMTYKKDTSNQDDDARYDEIKQQHDSDEQVQLKIKVEGNLTHKLLYNGCQLQSLFYCDPSHNMRYGKK